MSRNRSGLGFIVFIIICIIVAVFFFISMCMSDLNGGEATIC